MMIPMTAAELVRYYDESIAFLKERIALGEEFLPKDFELPEGSSLGIQVMVDTIREVKDPLPKVLEHMEDVVGKVQLAPVRQAITDGKPDTLFLLGPNGFRKMNEADEKDPILRLIQSLQRQFGTENVKIVAVDARQSTNTPQSVSVIHGAEKVH